MGKQPKSYDEWKKESEKSFNDFVSKSQQNFDDFTADVSKEFGDFVSESNAKFNQKSDLEQKTNDAKARIAEHTGTDIAAARKTMIENFGFDTDSLKISKVGKAGEEDIVIASKNGIAIGKGDTFYVAQDAGGMASLTEINVKSGIGMLMGKTNENIDIMDSTLDKMKTIYPAMGFDNKNLQESLEFAAADAHAYKLAMQGIDPIAIYNGQQKDK